MRRLAHAIIVVMAALPWLVSCIFFSMSAALVVLADRILPNARHGNCWSFAVPRWWHSGGYLLIRWANGMPIPHVAWVRKLSDQNSLEQTAPLNRVRSVAMIWKALYFPFRVTTVEKPQNAKDARQ